MTPADESGERTRFHLAWLMWCWREGYENPDDRGENWMLQDDSELHPDDRVVKAQLLTMADEVIEAMKPAEVSEPTPAERLLARVANEGDLFVTDPNGAWWIDWAGPLDRDEYKLLLSLEDSE